MEFSLSLGVLLASPRLAPPRPARLSCSALESCACPPCSALESCGVPSLLQMMQVTVPPGVSAGQTIMIATPAGQQLQVAVPAGVGPGQSFQVAVPAPAVATAVVVAVAAQTEVTVVNNPMGLSPP